MVEQLPEAQKQDLLQHLLKKAKQGELTAAEKIALLRASVLNVPVAEEPSIRREDWYGDDGR